MIYSQLSQIHESCDTLREKTDAIKGNADARMYGPATEDDEEEEAGPEEAIC